MEKIKILLNLHLNLLMNLEINKIKNLFNGMNNFIKKLVSILNIWLIEIKFLMIIFHKELKDIKNLLKMLHFLVVVELTQKVLVKNLRINGNIHQDIEETC